MAGCFQHLPLSSVTSFVVDTVWQIVSWSEGVVICFTPMFRDFAEPEEYGYHPQRWIGQCEKFPCHQVVNPPSNPFWPFLLTATRIVTSGTRRMSLSNKRQIVYIFFTISIHWLNALPTDSVHHQCLTFSCGFFSQVISQSKLRSFPSIWSWPRC